MLCPRCKVNLQMLDRQGVEIDYCPNCRGVWLDRGELDKVIERSTTAAYQSGYSQPAYAPSPPQPGYPPAQPGYPPQGQYNQPYSRRDDDDDDDWDDDDRRKYQGQPGYPPQRRKKGFLGDLFDF
jgi:uncharacterized protein